MKTNDVFTKKLHYLIPDYAKKIKQYIDLKDRFDDKEKIIFFKGIINRQSLLQLEPKIDGSSLTAFKNSVKDLKLENRELVSYITKLSNVNTTWFFLKACEEVKKFLEQFKKNKFQNEEARGKAIIKSFEEKQEKTEPQEMSQPEIIIETPQRDISIIESPQKTEMVENNATPMPLRQRRYSSSFNQILGLLSLCASVGFIFYLITPTDTNKAFPLILSGIIFCLILINKEVRKHE